MVVVITVRKGRRGERRAPFADGFPPEIHVAHKLALGFGARDANGFLGLQKIQIILNHLLRISLPILVLEVVVHLGPFLDDLATCLVVLVVIHKKILRGKQSPKDILILLKMPVDNPVCFLNEKPGRASGAAGRVLPITVTARHVLENLDGIGVPEKFPEEPHLLGVRALMRAHVFAVETGINRAGKHCFILQQTRHLTPEIILGGQFPVRSRLPQNCIRAAIAERIGNGAGRFVRSQFCPTVLIDLPVAEFHSIQKFRFQQHRREHLLQTGNVAAQLDG